jgi:hypothetical protein
MCADTIQLSRQGKPNTSKRNANCQQLKTEKNTQEENATENEQR